MSSRLGLGRVVGYNLRLFVKIILLIIIIIVIKGLII